TPAPKPPISKTAPACAATVFPTFQSPPAMTRRVIAWAWAGVIILVVPLAIITYQSRLYLATWMPHSAQHRIVIWGYTSNQIAKAPILGAGIDTSRARNDPQGYDAP